MDTTYMSIMLVVFLVIASLAVSIGYLYVDEEDMRTMAELSALAGAQDIKKRMLEQLRTDPDKLESIVSDTVQSDARKVAVDHAFGKHKESALMHAFNNDTNRLSTNNDVTVGFWNISTHTYTSGATPVNAMQVRIRRTAENDDTGIGNIGSILGVISGVQKFDYTPYAVAALPARANASFALCTDVCTGSCSFPAICSIPERRMVSDLRSPGVNSQVGGRYANGYLMYQLNPDLNLSDVICMETPPRELCSSEILTTLDPQNNALRDMESMMYNPNVDASNKEYDKVTGKLTGWWVIAPVTDCLSARQNAAFEKHTVKKYALIRISRICMPGATGCKQNNTAFDAPGSTCGADEGLYIDRISCVNCGSGAMLRFPGLHPVVVN